MFSPAISGEHNSSVEKVNGETGKREEEGPDTKGSAVTVKPRQFIRWFSTFLLALLLAAPALAQQPRTFQYLYDDLGQLKKAIDTTTGECIVYSYDQVGNITAIDRRTNCLAPPTFTSITTGSAPNRFTVTGQNLFGATVTTDIPGASVTNVTSSDDETTVNFCVLAPADSCNPTGTATITTSTGSIQAPVSASGATLLTPDAMVSDSINVLGEKDRYCFELTAPTRVVLQAEGTSGGVQPCVEVYTGSPADVVQTGSDHANPVA